MSNTLDASALVAPLSSLANVEGIVSIPYFSGIFEQFESYLTADETWDLSSILKVCETYSANTPILEIGCGNGRVSMYLAENGFSVHGIDNSVDALNRFQNRLLAKSNISNKIKIINSDIITYTSQFKYELIILSNLTIHLFNDPNALKSLFVSVSGLLSDSGKFCFSIFEEASIERMSMYKGNTFCTPFTDYGGYKNLVWRALRFDDSDNTLALSCFVQNRVSESEILGYLSAHKNKFWKLKEIFSIIDEDSFSLVKTFRDYVEGGGANGLGTQTIVLEKVIRN
ncbi:class I SAM-dependent methyltransferase [Hymenobacter defluvii]|uniref:Class I SAM-dependent methyltransferase n=1 Tax=Hymenobacter defluvii TaxID=2054411 RepID=A0ABS3TIL6_9BACT|nr:class I SAM-dependent methyltransferase [Hymenobacter defluvii]MBO3273499.1 class I SAM-dependent methyltransferase [Hymenobacter defluvii]